MRHPKDISIIREAFEKLFSGKVFNYDVSIKYSNRFSDYGANVYRLGNQLEFRLSKKWQKISDEIVIGLIQELLLRILNKKGHSTYIDLYNTFVKKLHIAIPKTKSHPILEASFKRVNDRYFFGIIEQPNLAWGKRSTTQMGLYDFKSDTITISKILSNADPDLLDYVMYHELLHKKTKFKSKNGRALYHSKEFKKAEREFENYELMEKKLSRHINRQKLLGFFYR